MNIQTCKSLIIVWLSKSEAHFSPAVRVRGLKTFCHNGFEFPTLACVTVLILGPSAVSQMALDFSSTGRRNIKRPPRSQEHAN